MGVFDKLKTGLSKTRDVLLTDVEDLFRSGINDETLEEFEELLITSDIGVKATYEIIEAITNGENRILLVMATGTGKTFTAFQIIWRLWKAKKKKRVNSFSSFLPSPTSC